MEDWKPGDDLRRQAEGWDRVAADAFKENDFGHYDIAKARAKDLRRQAREKDNDVYR